jgi:hypothetical protein
MEFLKESIISSLLELDNEELGVGGWIYKNSLFSEIPLNSGVKMVSFKYMYPTIINKLYEWELIKSNPRLEKLSQLIKNRDSLNISEKTFINSVYGLEITDIDETDKIRKLVNKTIRLYWGYITSKFGVDIIYINTDDIFFINHIPHSNFDITELDWEIKNIDFFYGEFPKEGSHFVYWEFERFGKFIPFYKKDGHYKKIISIKRESYISRILEKYQSL